MYKSQNIKGVVDLMQERKKSGRNNDFDVVK